MKSPSFIILLLALGAVQAHSAEKKSLPYMAPGHIRLIMGDDMLRLDNGSGTMGLAYRNATQVELKNLQLEIKSGEPITLTTRPKRILRCEPGNRCVFILEGQATKKTPSKRFFATVSLLDADGHELQRSDVLIDASPKAMVRERGWMAAGSIHIGSRSRTSRMVVLTLLGALPVLLLLSLGWWFRRRAEKSED